MDYPDYLELSQEVAPARPSVLLRFVTAVILILGILGVVIGLSFASDAILPLTMKSEGGGHAQNYDSDTPLFSSHDSEICVFLSLAGEKSTILTEPMTVGDFLDARGIVPDENDRVNYDRQTLMFNGMELIFDVIDEVVVTVEEPIPFRTEIEEVQTIPKDFSVVLTDGEDGLAERVISQVIVNGYVQEETVLRETILKPSVTCQKQLGIGGTFEGVDGKTYSYSYYVDGNATAYGGPEFSGLTATGVQVEIGMIAVDPDYIPLKDEVYIMCAYPGISGVYRTEDVGGAIKGNIIDIYMGMDFEPMYRFGRRNVRIYVHVEEVK